MAALVLKAKSNPIDEHHFLSGSTTSYRFWGCLGQIWVHSFFLHLTGMTTTGFWSYYNCLHFWTFLRPLLENTVEDTQDRFQMMYSHSDTSRPQAMLICFGLFMELASSASEVLEPSEMWKPSLKPLARAGGVTARSMQIYVNLKIHLVLHCLSRRHLLVVGHLCRQHSSGWTSRAVCFSISLTRWTVSINSVNSLNSPGGRGGFPTYFCFLERRK